VRLGAYVLSGPADGTKPQLVLVGTGSEVHLLVAAAEKQLADVALQIVSMPCWELFDRQPQSHQHAVFPEGVPVLAVEALAAEGWAKYAHSVVGMTTFGASAPGKDLANKFGFTVENVAAKARELLAFYEGRPAPHLIALGPP